MSDEINNDICCAVFQSEAFNGMNEHKLILVGKETDTEMIEKRQINFLIGSVILN